jgi:hypothetical protein
MAFNRGGSTENPAAETAATTPLGHKADSTGGQRSEVPPTPRLRRGKQEKLWRCFQNPPHFSDRLRITRRAVIGGDDQF